jgi:hypothetical protein
MVEKPSSFLRVYDGKKRKDLASQTILLLQLSDAEREMWPQFVPPDQVCLHALYAHNEVAPAFETSL